LPKKANRIPSRVVCIILLSDLNMAQHHNARETERVLCHGTGHLKKSGKGVKCERPSELGPNEQKVDRGRAEKNLKDK